MTQDPWTALRRLTAARIALGRSGVSLPTDEWLRFGLAHAQARDAVHQPFDVLALQRELHALDFTTLAVSSMAGDRATYLRRPDLGRRLAEHDRRTLRAAAPPAGRLVVVVGDGLSSLAVHRHAASVLREARPLIEDSGIDLAPVVLATQARVALGDDIGECWSACAVAVLIGERPGLSASDSLGIYLTWAPHVGCADAERNCVSNIRPEGLLPAEAARKLAWLLVAARRIGRSGVALKDDSDAAALPASDPRPALGGLRDPQA